eukprot:520377-Lingulodinium_polyedra.AAC.1
MRTRFACEREARATQTRLKIIVSKCVPRNSHMQMLTRPPARAIQHARSNAQPHRSGRWLATCATCARANAARAHQ